MKELTVFTDYHQTDLLYSLQLLFEDRLKGTLLRPIGMEWWHEGYWNVFPHEDTAKQYLSMTQVYQPKDGTLPLNKFAPLNPVFNGTPYICEDLHNNTYNRAITLDQFNKSSIDIIIASIPQHIKPYKELAKKKGAKFIFQMGNVFPEVVSNLHEIPNLMANTLPPNIPSSCNYIQYHQEFDLNVFKPSASEPEKFITSYINIYYRNKGFADFMSLKSIMLDYEFKGYGSQDPGGILNTTADIASMMSKSAFIFHSKARGDGFGHILYNSYACGKPVITRISDYKGKIGEELLTNNETCLDIDELTIEGVRDKIINMPEHEYKVMCTKAYDRFKEKVDYDKEQSKIEEFLERLN